jgi:hypothetical protein
VSISYKSMSSKKKRAGSPINKKQLDKHQKIDKEEISFEKEWELADQLMRAEEQKRNKIAIQNIGTFVDPETERHERETAEHNDYHDVVAFLNKVSTYITIQKIHSQGDDPKSTGRNWQSAPQNQLITKLMSLQSSTSQKLSVFKDM